MDGLQKRLLARLVIVGTGLFPMLCPAMGLSDIQIESRLNQPLRARIEILDVTADEWSRVRATLRQQTSLDNDVLHVEVLGSVTLRAIEDASHRHFVEVRSREVITEPLFDLPVEFATPTVRVIRTYTIMLDPIGSDVEEAGRVTEARAPTEQPAHAAEQIPTQAAGQSPASRSERTSTGVRSAPVLKPARPDARRPTRPTRPATPAPRPENPAPLASPQQDELKSQLDLLQQTLSKMQATIAAQNDQIMNLSAKVAAARSEPAVPRSEPAVARSEPTAARSELATGSADTEVAADVDEEDDSEPGTMLRTYVWFAVAGILAIGSGLAGFVLWRRRQTAPAPRQSLSPPPVSFEASEDARREEVPREAQYSAGTRENQSVAGPRETHGASAASEAQHASVQHASAPSHFGAAGQSGNASGSEPPPEFAPGVPFDVSSQTISRPSLFDRPPVPEKTVKLQALADTDLVGDLYQTENLPPLHESHEKTQELPAEYLEELPAAYISRMPLTSHPPRDRRPVDKPAQDANSTPPSPASTTPTTVEARAIVAQDGRSLVNKEVAEILEKSLGNDPNRVDIRIKLLEIYHHEVLGNRAEFNSLINQLIADPRMLTPAQKLHIEKLQRTLTDDKPENVAEFVKKVAI